MKHEAPETVIGDSSRPHVLLTNLGTDSINGIIQMAIGSISFGMSTLGKEGALVGNLVKVYGQEAARQATSLGNIAAMYMLYRFARKELYGQEQSVNEKVYSK